MITEDLSFIPDNILNSCEIIHLSRPTKNMYNKILNTKIPSNIKLDTITNIKNLYMDSIHKYNIPHKIICDNIFIYNLNVNECVWYIISQLILSKKIKKEYIKKLMKKIYSFFEYYNNNYRPIYHLEYLFYYIISLIHGY